ncbi:AI-2E family transporter [Methylocella silvestris]|uniref:Transporter n=1 Tax=Methylocella silvestris TaxID=199596 RepID=A0A2J7THM1_METSI|nr:AI-2E family transporter [Methylocella silvestris]PNG26274.1 transporter [Methylocella silvestris]
MSEPFDVPRTRPSDERDITRTLDMLATLMIATLCIVALYAARSVFVPIAIAVLLSFVLSPPVRLLRGLGLNRVVAVLIVVIASLAVTFAISAALTRQVSDLAVDLPKYQATITSKVASARELVAANGLMEKGASLFQGLGALGHKSGGDRAAAPAPEHDEGPKPIPVEVREAGPTPLSMLQTIVGTALSPLETIAIVVIFAIFILLQREDLRNRFISLVGTRDLQRTTVAMNDAAERLSRFFLAQTLLNAAFGVVVAAGLYVIGVPGPLLFGMIGFLMRFVPYIGAIVAAGLPVALAAAVDPGWTMALETLALFLVLELAVGQFIEPLLYGRNTGLSPIAVVVAATFWTWLWGPVGLVLSTPLTVCLVVLGRHVEQLNFLDVILGDAPALTPVEHFYQRMLVGDASEVADQAEAFLKVGPLISYYDEVALNGLLMAEADFRRGVLPEGRQKRIKEAIDEMIDDLADHTDEAPAQPPSREPPVADIGESQAPLALEPPPDHAPPEPEPGRKPVLCIAGRHPLDEAAAGLLAQILEKHGFRAKVEPADILRIGGILNLVGSGAQMICLSYLGSEASAAQVRYAIRRLRRRLPDAKIIVGFWRCEAERAGELCGQIRADACVTSLAEAASFFVAEANAQKAVIASPSAAPVLAGAA